MLDDYENLMQPLFLRLGGDKDQMWMDDVVTSNDIALCAKDFQQVQKHLSGEKWDIEIFEG